MMDGSKNTESTMRRRRGRPRDWHDKTEQNTIKSLDRAMAVYEHLSEDQGKSLSVLAADTGQSAATVYRILVTLEGRGLVECDEREQLWHIGARSFVIGSRFLRRTNLVERARPILRDLMEETGETANLAREQDGMVLFLNQVETHESIRAFFPPGTLAPMHSSGVGKALLAQKDADRFDAWYRTHPPQQFTQYTLTDRETLWRDLSDTRRRGYSVDGEEKNIGMRCIAAPVFDTNQEAIAGISVSGPTSRISANAIEPLAVAVRRAARRLTETIGGRDPAEDADR